MQRFIKRRLTFCILFISLSILLSHCIDGIQLTSTNRYHFDGMHTCTVQETDWWPMYQHDQKNSGFSTSTGPETNSILWMFNASGTIYSPAVADGLIYVGATNTTGHFSDSVLYCIDMTGQNIWSFPIDDELDSTPAIAYGKVYIGGKSGSIYCLDSQTGTLVWKVNTGTSQITSPIISNEKIIFGSSDGSIHCLDCYDGSITWNKKIGMNIRCSPAVVDEKVLIGNYCFDVNTGNILWNSEVRLPLLSSPSVYDTMVFIGSIDELFYCHNIETGGKIWDHYIGSMLWQYSPAVAYNHIYVGNAFGYIYCLDIETGNELWTTKKSARAVTSPAICDGKLYIGSYDTTFYCLDAFDGSTLWSYKAEQPWYSSPVIADGKVFASNADKLYCFGSNISHQSDLSVEGSLHWSKIKPGSLVEGSFTIKNIGQTDSKLSWTIISYPTWGNWTIHPENGNDLGPKDAPVEVHVQLNSPDIPKNTFKGTILIINNENETDFVQLNVSLSTVKKPFSIIKHLHILSDMLYSLPPSKYNIMYF